MKDFQASTSLNVPPMLTEEMDKLKQEKQRLTAQLENTAEAIVSDRENMRLSIQGFIEAITSDLRHEWTLNHDRLCSGDCTSFSGSKRCLHPRPPSLPRITS